MEKFNLEFYKKNKDNKNLKLYFVEYCINGEIPHIFPVKFELEKDNSVFLNIYTGETEPLWFLETIAKTHRFNKNILKARYGNHEYEIRIDDKLIGDLYYHIHKTDEKDFISDMEKMRDFAELPKNKFLNSYSYLSDEEYSSTLRVMEILINNQH